ncbi:MAG: cupin domain-containing protein [Melioribacter sp.]|nr:cupin domain-containing protein [Melioribacter sp.]
MPKNNISCASDILCRLAKNVSVKSSIIELQKELLNSSEQFVWKTLNEHFNEQDLETEFKSAWLFVLRKNTPSHAHYHPNSTQYTAVIDGLGDCEFGGIKISLQYFDPSNSETLYVINRGVPHEFFPGDKDLVVLSLHTVNTEELIEINCSSGKERTYE